VDTERKVRQSVRSISSDNVVVPAHGKTSTHLHKSGQTADLDRAAATSSALHGSPRNRFPDRVGWFCGLQSNGEEVHRTIGMTEAGTEQGTWSLVQTADCLNRLRSTLDT
jgi:hypothetical protein